MDFKIPLNRWTVLAAVAIVAIWGGDAISVLYKLLIALGYSYVPAA